MFDPNLQFHYIILNILFRIGGVQWIKNSFDIANSPMPHASSYSPTSSCLRVFSNLVSPNLKILRFKTSNTATSKATLKSAILASTAIRQIHHRPVASKECLTKARRLPRDVSLTTFDSSQRRHKTHRSNSSSTSKHKTTSTPAIPS